MQAIYKNEYKKDSGGRTDSVNTIIRARRIGRYLEEERIRRLEGRSSGV